MTRRFLSLLPMMAAALVFYFATPLTVPNEVQAQYAIPGLGDPNLKSVDKDGNRFNCSELPEAKEGVLVGAIVPCIIHTIEGSTQYFSQEMIDRMQPLIAAFMSFVGIMFGVRILQGERQLNSHAMLLLLKMGLVIAFLEMIPNVLVPLTYEIINEGVAVTTSVVGNDSSSINCEIDQYGDDNTPLLWKQMDCVLGKLYGFSTGNGTLPNGKKPVNMLLASSAVGLLSGFFFGGTIGVAVFFALLGVLWSLLVLVMRIVLAFINGYLIVCVMLLIAPIFLPLTLLKITSDYFEKWWKAILGGLLMPVIITAYSMFALLMYDKVLFAEDSLLNKLFENKLIAGVVVANTDGATQHSRAPCDFNVTNDPNFKADVNAPPNVMDEVLKSPFLQNFAKPLLSASSDACGMFRMPVFDITKVTDEVGQKDPDFADPKKAMLDLFRSSIELFILAFLIGAGLHTVEGVISGFSGSSLAGVALTARSKEEQRVSQAASQVKGNIARKFAADEDEKDPSKSAGPAGSEFIERAAKSVTGDFLGGVRR